MRDVDAAVRRHRLRHLDQLVGAGVVARRIDERRPDAERAVLHRAAHDGAHGVELRGVRLADRLALRVHAHRRRADERADVRRRCRARCIASSHAPKPCGPGYAPVPRGPPVANCPPAAVFSFVGAGVPPSPRISVVMPCVTLLTDRPSPRKFVPLWMSMKPGATTRPRDVDALLRREAPKRSGRPDARDAVAHDGDVAEEPGGAGSVDRRGRSRARGRTRRRHRGAVVDGWWVQAASARQLRSSVRRLIVAGG